MGRLKALARGKGLAFALALSLPFLLASCYIPDKFRSEMRVSRHGDWALSYEGDLIYAPMLHDYAEGRVTPEDEQGRHDRVRADLIRDTAFKTVAQRGKGRFHVVYERSGRLGKVQLTSILRRDARLISLKSHENGVIQIDANAVSPRDAQRMGELTIGMSGEFRITTDANVIKHNAGEVRAFGKYNVYIWKIENALSPTPHLVMIRDPDPTRPLQ